MRRIPLLAIALVLCIGLMLAPAILAQDVDHHEGEEEPHEEDPHEENGHEEANGHDDHHDGNDTHHEEEYHDPWMNLYITGGVIVAFMVAVVVWPKR
jgi:ABC-type Zn2+ transport system substrate-binding protein/surface adhesin